MKQLPFYAFICISIVGCTPFQPALTNTTENLESHEVKGRNGILINQKLSFGNYQTSKVKRSWTKGGNARVPVGVNTNLLYFGGIISKDYTDRNQTFHFQMTDSHNNIADVYASSEFHAEDLIVGDNPNSLYNILEDLNSDEDEVENFFYLQIYTNQDAKPWELILDNHASQAASDTYTGIFGKDDTQFYKLKPITKVKTKKGPRAILMGSLGFEILDSKNNTVAAVSLVDNGQVFFQTKDINERFLLANLCAALLLQQQIES